MSREQKWTAGAVLLGMVIGVSIVYVGATHSVELGFALYFALFILYLVLRWAYVRYLLPRLLPGQLAKLVVADAGPPPDALPIRLQLAERFAEAGTNQDPEAAMDLTSEKFMYRYAPRNSRTSRRRYKTAQKVLNSAYATCEMVVRDVRSSVDPPTTVWVQFDETMVPHRGPAVELTWWERWELNVDQSLLLDAECIGLTHLERYPGE